MALDTVENMVGKMYSGGVRYGSKGFGGARANKLRLGLGNIPVVVPRRHLRPITY